MHARHCVQSAAVQARIFSCSRSAARPTDTFEQPSNGALTSNKLGHMCIRVSAKVIEVDKSE
eukprot:5194322-Prorocentrum_lima.AAC.1